MKKLLLIFLLFFAAKSFAQYPLVQGLGNDSTLIRVGQNYKGGIKGGLINMTVTDTAAANLLRIKAYPGSQIFTTNDGLAWMRNSTATGWFLLGGGTSPSGSFWKIGGNLFPVTVPSRNIGTLAPYGGAIGLMTNSVVHAIVPDAGFTLSNDTTNTKVFTWNPTSKEWGYANWNNGGGGATPTLQQVLTAGSTLTDNNTIDVDLNNFTIDRADNDNLRLNNINNSNKTQYELDLDTPVNEDEFEIVTAPFNTGKNTKKVDKNGDPVVGKNPRLENIPNQKGTTIAVVRKGTNKIIGFINDRIFAYNNSTPEIIESFTATRDKYFPDKLEKGTDSKIVKDLDLRNGDEVIYLSEGKMRKGKFEDGMIRDENGNLNGLISIITNPKEYLMNVSAIKRKSFIPFLKPGTRQLNPQFNLAWIGMEGKQAEIQDQLNLLSTLTSGSLVKTIEGKLRFPKENATTNLTEIEELFSNSEVSSVSVFQRIYQDGNILYQEWKYNRERKIWEAGEISDQDRVDANTLAITYNDGHISNISVNVSKENELKWFKSALNNLANKGTTSTSRPD